jgi:hypothetical protein
LTPQYAQLDSAASQAGILIEFRCLSPFIGDCLKIRGLLKMVEFSFKKMHRLVFLILFLMSFRGQAQLSCQSLFVKSTQILVNVEASPEFRFINPKTPYLFSEWIQKINSQLSQNVKIPKKITLNIAPYNFEPEAKPENYLIHIGERFAIGNEEKIYFKDPSYSFAILTHEYAHILFYEKSKEMISMVSDFKFINDQKDILIDQFNVLHKEKVKLLFQKSQDLDEKSLNYLNEREKEVDAHFKELEILIKEMFKIYKSAIETMEKYYRRKSPYDELFADVVAIMIKDDPQTISKALSLNGKDHFIGTPKELKLATQYKKIENKRREFLTHITRYENADFYSPHGVFAQVRQFLWESYLRRPEVRYRQRSLFISKTLDSILKELQWTLDEYESLSNQDFQMLNDHLIQRLREDLREFAPKNINHEFSRSE